MLFSPLGSPCDILRNLSSIGIPSLSDVCGNVAVDTVGDDDIGNPCGDGNRWRRLLLEVKVGCNIGGATVQAISGLALLEFR